MILLSPLSLEAGVKGIYCMPSFWECWYPNSKSYNCEVNAFNGWANPPEPPISLYINFLNFLLFYMYRCLGYMYNYVPLICLEPVEARRGHHMPCNWSYGLLWDTLWVLGTEPRFSRSTGSALNCWAIFPRPHIISVTEVTINNTDRRHFFFQLNFV